jgi:hypothetical protein
MDMALHNRIGYWNKKRALLNVRRRYTGCHYEYWAGLMERAKQRSFGYP